MERRLRLAIGANLAIHGPLVAAARHRISYDAYVHMFLADHYRRDWWTLWEPRWYTGFSVASYPPLVHQVVALFARLVGLEVAYGVVLLAVLAALPLAIYAFARVFVGRRAAGYAALVGAVLPGISVTAHAFGQLPTLAALVAALLLLATLSRYLEEGRAADGGLAVVLAGVVGAVHHGTLLLLPWGVAAVAAQNVITERTSMGKSLERLARVLPVALAATVFVVWPFWRWGLGQTMQTPIDHLSRHSFFLDPSARRLFFWAMYGPMALLMPVVAWVARENRRVVPAILFAILFLLGLGATTPLPRWLFGSRWAWLTYDRFALWAGVVLLIFAGAVVVKLEEWVKRLRWGRQARVAGVALGVLLALTSIQIAIWSAGQPPRVDMGPIVDFLAEGERSRWRYVTFGLGDQMGRLSVLTEATTIDGAYHTARQLPELRKSGIGKIDTAFWSAPGLEALHPILERADERGVRWAFVNRDDYERALAEHGWTFARTLANGVDVWVNPAAEPPELRSAPNPDPAAAVSWGVLPLLALTVAGGLGAARLSGEVLLPLRRMRRRLGEALGHVHHLAAGLLPVALGFWTYRVILRTEHTNVYFVYDDVLFYLSDGVALAAVIAWGGKRLLGASPGRSRGGLRLRWILSLLVGLAACSVVWSASSSVSFYMALHFGLALALFLSLADDPDSWRFVAIGSFFALLFQGGAAIIEFLAQSTAFLAPLGLTWPGILTPDIRGASVVELVDGTRWLRAYGTLPHPNILGGWLIALMAAPAARFLKGRRRAGWALGFVGLGIVALMLSFSRSAWLGLLAGTGVMFLHHRILMPRRMVVLGSAVAVCVLATVVPLRALFYTRLTEFSVHTEARSIRERRALGRQAADLIEAHPLLGTGIGAFVPALSEMSLDGAPVEPEHNVVRLATAELGIGGGVLVLGAAGAILNRVRRAQTVEGVVLSAAVVGLMLAALFDHYVWSLAPGRTMLAVILGVWAGQTSRDESAGEPMATALNCGIV